MEPDLAALVLDSLAITVTDLEAAGADPYDLEPLTAITRLVLASRKGRWQPVAGGAEGGELVIRCSGPGVFDERELGRTLRVGNETGQLTG